MAFPIRHKLLTVIGGYATGPEELSFSVRIIPPTGGEAVSQAQVDSLAAATQTMWTSVTTNFPSVFKLLAIKLAPIDVTGNYPTGEIAYEHPFTGVAGSGDLAALQAPQVATCVTLLTAAPRGRGHAGRMYLPSRSNALSADGRWAAGQQDNINTPVRTWLNAINAASGVGTVGVLSSLGSGTSRVVTAVRCGRVYDTQRRRRRALDEDYHVLAL